MALIPQGARILVSRQAPKETVLPGGLVMPASAGAAKDPVERGEIVAASGIELASLDRLHPGAVVHFKRSKGVEVTDGPARYCVVDVADVLAVEVADS